MKSNDTYRVEVLKDPTTFVEVEVVEKNAPRELNLSVRRYLEGHMIKKKKFVGNDLEENIKITKFNSSDETRRFFFRCDWR